MKNLKSFVMMLLLLPCMFIFTACGNDNPSQNSAYAIVSFDTDGGSVIEDVKVKKGEKIQAPENPTKDYFEFICWCYNDKEWSFENNVVNNNITLKANWKNTAEIFKVDEETGTITGLIDYGKTLSSIEIPRTINGIEIKEIGYSAFYKCSSLTSITIPESVTIIGVNAFCYCSSLTSITIPDSVTSFGAAFYWCSSLTSVTIGNSVTSIGGSAFSGCSSLTSVTIPDSVSSIGYGAFYNCNKLSRVYYKGTASEWSKISIDSYNSQLTSATRYYYSETKPTESGNYWHYDADGVTIIKW